MNYLNFVNGIEKVQQKSYHKVFKPYLRLSKERLFTKNKAATKNNRVDRYLVNMDLLEKELDKVFNCELAKINLGGGKKQAALCKKMIRRYDNYGHINNDRTGKTFFDYTAKPSAMLVRNMDELAKKTAFAYQFAYAHYILGKYNRMKDVFPKNCCGSSAENLVVALWEAGFLSAIKVFCSDYDHAYVIIPFVICEPRKKRGIILIDPTSDQLHDQKEKQKRNLIRVITQKSWLYQTDWRYGANLFPNLVNFSICFGKRDKRYDKYLRLAFKNPILVDFKKPYTSEMIFFIRRIRLMFKNILKARQ